MLDEELQEGNNLVESIAEVCGVPPQALLSRRELPISPMIDFRSTKSKNASMEQGLIKALAYVEKLSYTVASLDLTPKLDARVQRSAQLHHNMRAEDLADYWRGEWGLSTEDQLALADSNAIYKRLRDFIESLGIFVLHFGMRSDETSGLYTQIDGGPHTIVINTAGSSKARKLFTLAHEFGHVIISEEGISNTSQIRNKIERYCNRFAACLIAPDEVIQSAIRKYRYTVSENRNVIRLLAKNIGVSQEALVRRLVEMGLLAKHQYNIWRASFAGMTPPEDMSDGGGGGASDPIQNKITQYGKRLLSVLREAYQRKKLDDIGIYRVSGLKPKYQKVLFEDVAA